MEIENSEVMIDRTLNYGRHVIESYMRSLEIPEVIADLGAGRGDDLQIAINCFPKAEYHAVECYPPYVEALLEKGVNVHTLNIERDLLPFKESSVDIVIANQILEHTKELFWIFHEVSRALRVGGVFIIGIPNLASLHNRLLLLAGRQPTSIKSASAHVRGFTKKDLINFVESCFSDGYELIRFAGSNFYPFPRNIAMPLANLFPDMSWGIFLMLRKKREYEGEFLLYPVQHQLETNYFLGK